MIRTILWYVFFWLYMIGSLSLFIPVILLNILNKKLILEKFIHFLAKTWARSLLFVAGGHVTVTGQEYIPKSGSICVIANHQSGFDIPLILAYFPKTIGFIAKKELLYIPILGMWMKMIHCLFLDRSDKRGSVKVIQRGIEQIQKGYPMAIFPEGTRSKSNTLGIFKSGSLKLALRSKAKIVPLSIDGSYKLKELRNGLITSASVKLQFHPVIDTNDLSTEEQKYLVTKLRNIINAVLEESIRKKKYLKKVC